MIFEKIHFEFHTVEMLPSLQRRISRKRRCLALTPTGESLGKGWGGVWGGAGCRLTLGLIFRENREFMGIKGK